MQLESPTAIIKQAKDAWNRNAADNRRVVLFYALPALILPLMVMVINLFLNKLLAGTGGLSGIGMRSAMETIQTVLSGALRLALPFWQLGLTCCALSVSRGQNASTDHLFEGFRRWGAALRLMIFRTFRYVAGIFCGAMLSGLLLSVTPLSSSLISISEAIINDPAYANATAEEIMNAVMSRARFWDIAPYYILCGLSIALATIPLFYRYRMSDYVLLDSEKPGALLAIRKSTEMMFGNAKWLFALDLRFWWYYLLLLIPGIISYGDLLLPALGIALPFSEEWAMVIFSLLSAAAQLAYYYLFRGRIETTYACAYEFLKNAEGGNEPL